MTHRYVEIAAEIAAWAPLEAAELATADERGMVRTARTLNLLPVCPGKLVLGRAVAIRDAQFAAIFGSDITTRIALEAARQAALQCEVTVELRRWAPGRTINGDGDDVVSSGWVTTSETRRAGDVPAAREAIWAAVRAVEAEVASNPTVANWRRFAMPVPPKEAGTLSDMDSVPASQWETVKARWAALDVLQRKLEKLDISHPVYSVER